MEVSMNALEQLGKVTVIVADTGDIEAIKLVTPRDATTNPSLIYKANQDSKYAYLLEEAVEYAKANATGFDNQVDLCMDCLSVNYGKEILKVVPGRVSTELDARYSFNTEASIEKGRKLIAMYEEAGISRDRILIKIASTWEGIKAAEVLEKEGIHCNLTLLFSFAQAVACAEANVTLISPFVGRIYDWHKKARGVEHIAPTEDPGVESVTAIFNYYKKFGYKTEVMGASFRNNGEIRELAGCDLLTISPGLINELEELETEVPLKLDAEAAKSMDLEKVSFDESAYRMAHNEDAMAVEKLGEGIRNFCKDIVALETQIKDLLK